jgi:hypothetical protein
MDRTLEVVVVPGLDVDRPSASTAISWAATWTMTRGPVGDPEQRTIPAGGGTSRDRRGFGG